MIRGENLPSVRKYFRNRALRILPAYLVILLVVDLVLRGSLVREGPKTITTGTLDAWTLAKNLLLVQNYAPGSVLTGIGPAWSLAVEAVFYVTLPLLVALAVVLSRGARTRARRRLCALAPAAVVLAVGLAGKAVSLAVVPHWGGWDGDWYGVFQRSFLCQADLFTFGIALAALRVDWEDGLLRLPSGWRPAALGGALATYLVATVHAPVDVQLGDSPRNTVMALGCALVLALVVLETEGRSAPFLRLLEARPVVFAGLISYSVFLWHEPLVRWLAVHDVTFAGKAGFFANLVMLAALTGALSTLTYRFVELPALRRKRRAPARTVDVPATDLQAAP